MIIAYSSNNGIPEGYLLCDGAAVSRSTYSSLYSVISTTWGNGNGSTTFNLPNLSSYWIKGSSTAGSSVSAGLPNITGSFSARSGIANSPLFSSTQSGAFSPTSMTGTRGFQQLDASISGASTVNFSAKNSNSIYGTSSTVSVSSKTVRFIIKY